MWGPGCEQEGAGGRRGKRAEQLNLCAETINPSREQIYRLYIYIYMCWRFFWRRVVACANKRYKSEYNTRGIEKPFDRKYRGIYRPKPSVRSSGRSEEQSTYTTHGERYTAVVAAAVLLLSLLLLCCCCCCNAAAAVLLELYFSSEKKMHHLYERTC